jgi:hypothetical protein
VGELFEAENRAATLLKEDTGGDEEAGRIG